MRLYNPVYHFKQTIGDIHALRHGFSTLGQPQTFTSSEGLGRILHGRLALAATISFPATLLGITVGALVQTETGNFEAGLLTNLIIANIVGVIGLEVLWAWLSRDLYLARNQHGLQKVGSVIRDLRVIHLHSLIGVLVINAISMGLTTFILEGIHHWQPTWNLNRYVPATLISPIFGFLLLDAPFIRHMYDLYATHARALAHHYEDLIVPEPPVPPDHCVEVAADQIIHLYGPEKTSVTGKQEGATEPKKGQGPSTDTDRESRRRRPKLKTRTVRRPL